MTPAEAREKALKDLQGREPLTGEYQVRLKSAPVERLALAQLALDEAEEAEYAAEEEKASAVARARDELSAAQEQLDAATVTLTFEGLAPEDVDALLEKHPPTDEETAEAESRGLGRPQYGRTFRPALVAATCTFPGFISAEEANTFLWGGKARLSINEADDVFQIAWAVSVGRREVVDWGKDFARTRG